MFFVSLARTVLLSALGALIILVCQGCSPDAPEQTAGAGIGSYVRPELFGGDLLVPEPDIAQDSGPSGSDGEKNDEVLRSDAGLTEGGRFVCREFSFLVCESWRDSFASDLIFRDDAGFITAVYRFYFCDRSRRFLVFSVEKRERGFSLLYGEYGGILLARSAEGDSFILVTEQPEFPEGFTVHEDYMDALAFSLSDELDFRLGTQ